MWIPDMSTSFILNASSLPEPFLNRKEKKNPHESLDKQTKGWDNANRSSWPDSFSRCCVRECSRKRQDKINLKDLLLNQDQAYKNIEKELNPCIHIIERNRRQKKNHSCGKITKIIISSNITIFIIVFSCQNSSVQRRRNISVTAADRRVAPARRTATLPAAKR